MSYNRTLVLGAGNFGTCLAHHLARKGEDVTLWARDKNIVSAINNDHRNPSYLTKISLAPTLKAIDNLDENRLSNFNVIVIAIPTQFMRKALETFSHHINSETLIVCASKGIEIGSLKMPISIVEEMIPQVSLSQIGIISGPSFAIEVAQDMPTSVSIASTDANTAKAIQKIFHTGSFRAYTSSDPIGLEVAGALKNVIAIASGAASGLGMENNALAALLTRGLAEITRVGVALGSNPVTFSGLGGVGDLFLTCTSDKSRNFRVGRMIGQGKTLESVTNNLGSIAEGVATAKSAHQLAKKLNVDTPIINTVYSVIYDKKPLQQAVKELFEREMKAEIT